MLDPEYVKRIDCEMEESGGQLAPDDHEGVWENLKLSSEWGAELEFSIVARVGVIGQSCLQVLWKSIENIPLTAERKVRL